MKKIIFLLAAFIFFSCQTSKITNSWTAENVHAKKYKNVLVLAVMKEDDRELLVNMENHLAGDLKDLGYKADASNKIFPPGTFVKGDTARAVAAINSKNFDAVLTIVLLNKVKEKYYVPGRVAYTPSAPFHDHYDRYYFTMQDRIYSEGYYAVDTKIFWETNFYDIAARQMVYSAQTRSFDPGSKVSLAHYFGVLISDHLVKRNILVKPDNPNGF